MTEGSGSDAEELCGWLIAEVVRRQTFLSSHQRIDGNTVLQVDNVSTHVAAAFAVSRIFSIFLVTGKGSSMRTQST